MTDKPKTLTLKQQDVFVERGRDRLSATIPEHEVEVLKAIHGLDAVTVADDDVGEQEVDPSAEAEFSRLQRAYQRPNAPDPVLIAFRGGPSDLERFGFVFKGASPEKPVAAEIVDHNREAYKAKKKAAAK